MVANRVISEYWQHINISTSRGSVDCTDDLSDQILKEKKMNRLESITKPGISKPMIWLTALLLAAIVAGCGGTHDGVANFATGPGSGSGPAGASPVLGTASSYGIIAGTAVTLNGSASIIGDLAISPGTSLTGTGTVSGTKNLGNAAAHQALLDQNAAFTDASTRSAHACSITAGLSSAQGACTGYVITPGTNSTVGTVTAATYEPGLYSTASTIALASNMILDAKGNQDAVFIFKSGSAITTGTSSKVILTGSAQAKNVWWVAPAGATLGVTSTFAGTVLADSGAVVVDNGTTVAGRLFSNTAAATVDTGSTITAP